MFVGNRQVKISTSLVNTSQLKDFPITNGFFFYNFPLHIKTIVLLTRNKPLKQGFKKINKAACVIFIGIIVY